MREWGRIEPLTAWWRGSIRNKILCAVGAVLLAVYAGAVAYIHRQTTADLADAASDQALSTVRILALTLFRGYEPDADSRLIQSYVVGVQRAKADLLDLTVLDASGKIVSSTQEQRLMQRPQEPEFMRALANEASLHPTGEAQAFQIRDLRVVYPISAGLQPGNRPTGALEVVFSLDRYRTQAREQLQGWLLAGLILAGATALMIVWIAASLTRPIRRLYAGMKQVNAGDLDVQVEVSGADEIGYATRTFNTMVNSVRDQRHKLEGLNVRLEALLAASSRFVPRPFLTLLDKRDLTDVHSGDATELTMAVLFLDVRGFTSLSERLQAGEVLSLLNEVLSHMLPAIETHRGFVDKYIGDAIMALFPGGVADAIGAAVTLRQRLADFNGMRPPANRLDVGIGVHAGDLILGTLGSEERLETTVIGHTVNAASRLEALTKQLGFPILFPAMWRAECERALGDEHAIVDLGEVEIRGMRERLALCGIRA